MRETERKG